MSTHHENLVREKARWTEDFTDHCYLYTKGIPVGVKNSLAQPDPRLVSRGQTAYDEDNQTMKPYHYSGSRTSAMYLM